MKVLLVGNYALDGQQSMLRFAQMMLDGLTAAGVPAEIIAPQPLLGRFRFAGSFVAKWLAYFDKYLLFPRQLRRRVARGASLVHICDHSNAVYVDHCRPLPVVVTCHDLLAVRGGLGEETKCPATFTGRILQRWILRALGRADVIACDSTATLQDAERLITTGLSKIRLASLGLNFPYRKLAPELVRERLNGSPRLADKFILHVGSNLARKNRDGILRIFARTKDRWNGVLVFAGEPLSPDLHSLADKLGISDRIIEVNQPPNELLEALYSAATALIYPSYSEGFGWPIAEAQACGCPVICSDAGPVPDVVRQSAIVHRVDDEDGFAADILRLADTQERERWSALSRQNAERFAPEKMIRTYLEIYRELVAAV